MQIDSSKVVAITGASRGIGRAAAIEFAKKGAKVVLLSRDLERMNGVEGEVRKAGSEALSIPCDVSKEHECRRWVPQVIERFGRVDVLINNAGYGHYSSIENLTTDNLRQIFDTNLMGSIWCAQAVIPEMRKRGEGHIVNVSTIISRRAIPYMSAYCMTKFAMNAFDESLRLELRHSGVGVSLVCPGLTATDFQMNAKKSGAKPPRENTAGMTAEKVGKAILKAVERNKRRTFLTTSGRILLFLNKVSPVFVDEVLFRAIKPTSGQ
jgi:short-subunit dehydrogenase